MYKKQRDRYESTTKAKLQNSTYPYMIYSKSLIQSQGDIVKKNDDVLLSNNNKIENSMKINARELNEASTLSEELGYVFMLQ